MIAARMRIVVSIVAFYLGAMTGAIATSNPWFAIIVFWPPAIGLSIVNGLHDARRPDQ